MGRDGVPEVLVPDRVVAPGLRRLLQELGLTLRSGGTSLHIPEDWISRIQGSCLALVVADWPADSRAGLRRRPLGPWPLGAWPLGAWPQGSRPHSPVWLALPADWQEHPLLRRSVRELGRLEGLQQLEG